MAIEGALQDVGLADICQLLSMGRKTGCLSLTDRANFGYVYFDSGRVIYASVLDRPDRLGELLVRNDVITRDQLSEAMELQARQRGVRLGQVLVNAGSLETDDLHRYIQLQIEEAVYQLFTWQQGSFHFDPDQRPDEDDFFLVSFAVETLLMEGARRVDEWSEIQKKIPSLDVVFEVLKDPEEADDIEITDHQRRVLPLVDGERTVHEIVEHSGLVEFDVGKALFPLVQAGFIAQAGTGTRPAPEADEDDELARHLELGIAFYRAGMYEDATREFDEALAQDPDHPDAHFRRALIAFRQGRFEEALGSFDLMPDEARDCYAVHRNRALILELTGRYDDALAVLDDAEAHRPRDPEIALARGIVRLRKGDVSAALQALDAYRRHPDVATPSAAYYAYTVLAAGLAGRHDYAVDVGREGLAQYPDCGELLVNQAAVLEHTGQAQAAEALYVRATRQTPPPAQAHKALGDVALARGDEEAARSHYQKAQKLEPRLGDDLYVKLGMLAWKDEDHDVARLLWTRALELNPQNPDAQAQLEALDTAS
jgi:tetratricopeptide (TPR) repeat protein